MSLVPAFDIGIWNAWILTLVLYAAAFVPLSINNEKAEKRMAEEPAGSEQNKTARIVHIITHVMIMPLTLIYSIFLPLQLGSWWFFTGLVIYLLGLVLVLMSSILFSTAPLDEPISKGVYAISRHPSYVGFFLAYAGIGISCASWVYLSFAVVWMISWNFGVEEEERILLDKYGDTYRTYLDRTPKWIGFPKI
jgi:protein-S-isoprenylcysteine O-methyltransferase Ste14